MNEKEDFIKSVQDAFKIFESMPIIKPKAIGCNNKGLAMIKACYETFIKNDILFYRGLPVYYIKDLDVTGDILFADEEIIKVMAEASKRDLK